MGIESVRSWVRQADLDDGQAPGVSSVESQRVKELEQENRELKRANEILKPAAGFFGAELNANTRSRGLHRHLPWRVRGRAHLHRSAISRRAGGPEHLLREQKPARPVHEPNATRRWVQSWWRCGRTTTGSTGARKLWKTARRAGHDVGRDQCARLMAVAGIEEIRRAASGCTRVGQTPVRRGIPIWSAGTSPQPHPTSCGRPI
jgi:transposase